MSLQAFTSNSKTILSVDFNRAGTCYQICDYCYVSNTERIYPAYAGKIKKNDNWAKLKPYSFAKQLNEEYKKLRKSKAVAYQRVDKLPVRIYGSGDFIPEHREFLRKLDFKFYIISKNLTETRMLHYINELHEYKNLTKIILSLDDQNIGNYENIKQYYKSDKFGISYTGLADNFNSWKNDKGLNFTIFFNISTKKIERAKSKLITEQCPCDSGALAHNKSCSYCNKCWRSSITKDRAWNMITPN